MKVKLQDIWNSQEVLKKLASGKAVSAKANYFIGRTVTKFQEELQTLSTTRMSIFKKYGTLDEKTNIITVAPENKDAWYKEILELFDTEIEANIPMLEIEYLEGMDLNCNDMIAINFLINEPK